MLRRSPGLLGLALITAGVLSIASFRVPLSGGTREFGTFRQQSPNNWFTVMGHVGRPQVYQLPTSSPSLAQFIQFAGDLKPTASGQIRVVRNGRVAVRIRYSAKSTEKLIPGDLVIVDGKMAQGTVFRGRNSNAPQAGPLQIGLVGVRPWPIIMESNSERATIRWITQQLGQDVSVVEHVKAVRPRNFSRTTPDSRLEDGSVLIFEPAWVDVSRLPEGLPEPIDVSRPPAGNPPPIASARPPAPLPFPVNPNPAALADRARTAVPGHSALPAPGDADPGISRNEEEFTRDVLTDPRSVPLETHTAPAPGRARASDRPGQSDRNRPAPQPDARIAPSPPSGDAPAEGGDAVFESPEAERPFSSQIEQPAVIEHMRPVPEIVDAAPSNPPASAGPEPGLMPEPDPLDDAAEATAAIAAPAGVSLAMQGATSAAGSDPSPAPDGNGPAGAPVIADGPLQPVAPTNAIPGSTGKTSQLIPKAETPWNWPVIAICSIGGLGLLAAAGMILSMARQDTTARPTPEPRAVVTERNWLDRIINDELPIDDEPIQVPAGETLFGQPARMVRIDEPHATIPKPHFLKRGGQSGSVPVTPGAPDEPEPNHTDDNDQPSRPTTYAPRRHDRPTTRRPGRPEAPARPAATADQPTVVEPAAEADLHAESDQKATPPEPKTGTKLTFRVDTAHPATNVPAAPKPRKRTPGTRPGKPADSAAKAGRDEGLLDRILFQVDQGDRS